jgi:hypothetical protein
VRMIFSAAAFFISLAPAGAQTVRTADFTVSSDQPVQTTQTKRFCLPSSERLVKINTDPVKFADPRIKVSFTPDTAANCIVFTATLPAAQKICTRIPVPKFPSIRWEDKCDTVQSSLTLSIDYESKPADVQQ